MLPACRTEEDGFAIPQFTLNPRDVEGFMDELHGFRSCTASVRLMHGVWSKPICGRNMSLLAGLTWGGSSLHSTPHDGLLTPWASRG
jgi:hypothetical protein